MEQILSALVAIIAGVGGMVLYFYGANWLLDNILKDTITPQGRVVTSRDRLREGIRPWLFVGPALFLLGLYLVFPAIQTLILSFYDTDGVEFVGLANYEWMLGAPEFHEAVGNNILWLLVVPALSTALGLLIAVLADGVRWGALAKSLIFAPMAISFIGASVIWRFMYHAIIPNAGDAPPPQIGLVNAIVVSLGGQPQDWITLEFWNNFFLMAILVWIQTGYAMVLLASALRGVPEETLEAARIDGAGEIAIFFRIMVPQIMGTIIVVWTTITITVLKVFDIVLAMTNGQFGTQVLANLMFDQAFRAFHDGRGSAVAIFIMVAVIPILYWNIRNYRRAEMLR
ncbi:MAG: sugar ABC transporter permease [Anaerolineae bacterium]